ncbi:hypothetical protein BH24CHL9_BH24CHL9_08500 [soil metagenome]
MGFGLFAEPAHASDTVTSVHMPGGVEWTALNKALRERGLVLAGGQGRLSGQIFRVGHLGDVQLDDIVSALEVLEAAARELGLAVEPGVGPAAARQAAEDRLAGLRGPAAVGV